MSLVVIQRFNESKLRVLTDDQGILNEIGEHFTFYADGYKFMPAFRNRQWDGKIRLFDRRAGLLPSGLRAQLLKFLDTMGYDVEDRFNHDREQEDYGDFLEDLTYGPDGDWIPRDYQKEAFEYAINNEKALLVSPTASGKSMIMWMCAQWYLENYRDEEKILIVVPTTTLVEQLYGDFQDYMPEWNIEEYAHRIYSGKEKHNIDQPIIITTWQSAYKLGKAWFEQFGMIIGDEAHQFKAKNLGMIMESLTNCRWRIGTTGTLDGKMVNEMQLEGSFGPPKKIIDTVDLIEKGTLAECKIKNIVLEHDRKKIENKSMTYQEEIEWLVTNKKRNAFLKKLATTLRGNTLVLFRYVEKHGEPLYEDIKESVPDRPVYFVSGKVDTEVRNEIRGMVENHKDSIIVASMATFSTGINIRNLHNIVFASPTKSQIAVLQSIGRGLRKSDDGKPCTVYDIIDDIKPGLKNKNYSYKHGIHRNKIYLKEGFPTTSTTIRL